MNDTIPSGGALRPRAAAQYLGIGESSLWARIKNETGFPQPIPLGPRMTVLLRSELDAYLATKRAQAGERVAA
jgi:predicted DNA-binding transcriptional regulator AlpA